MTQNTSESKNDLTLEQNRLLKVHLPIKDADILVEKILFKIKNGFMPSAPIGLIDMDRDYLQKIFQPHLDALGLHDCKISRGWAHFMREDATRPSHQHTMLTGLYYLKIPENSAKLKLEDTDEIIEPLEGDFYILPEMIDHSITVHRSKELRLAIAFEVVNSIR